MTASLLSTLVLALALLPGVPASAEADPPEWLREHPLVLPRVRIGVHVQSLTPELREHFGAPADRGLLVGRVEPDGPAERAGVRVGDVVLAVGETPVDRPVDLIRVVSRAKPGEKLTLEILRKGKQRRLEVEPEERKGPWMGSERFEEWMERGFRQGREHLRRRVEELERRLEELERRLDEQRGQQT